MNYWYAARPNEIFLDLDSRKSMTRALRVLKVWMAAPFEKYGLPKVKAVYHYPTGREKHCHVIVELAGYPEGGNHSASTLALWMGSDRLRAAYVKQRESLLGTGTVRNFSDLLCASHVYHREPDFTCECPEKHKDKSVTDNCHALKMMLGVFRSADFFPRVGHKPIPFLRVPIGRVPLTTIRRWKNGR